MTVMPRRLLPGQLHLDMLLRLHCAGDSHVVTVLPRMAISTTNTARPEAPDLCVHSQGRMENNLLFPERCPMRALVTGHLHNEVYTVPFYGEGAEG